MKLQRLSKRFFKIIVILVGSLAILLTLFHFWFVNHAEELLQNMVASKSNGKLRLQVGNFKFNWFSKKMELERAVFYTTDSADANTAYQFAVRKINLKVKAVLPMIFEKRVLINLLSLKEPDIIVTKLRSYEKDTVDNRESEDISIPREMGRIYNSIQDAIRVLRVKKFEIEDATFTLVNRANPTQHPVYISHIDFHIDNLEVDSTDRDNEKKILFSDNIVLKSRDQEIMFPDGRHKLSYRKFRINIEKRIVELDSCTIAAIKTDSSAAAFSIFFDELLLTNIDFDTLYRTEVIKADSVYALNPRFQLDVEMDKRKGPRGAPKLDRIIQQLTGDLMLNFVVVNNASFNINTLRDDKVNTFSSENNNFEMKGLSIDKGAEKPLKVEKFSMAIRNYKTFLRDSTYEMRFDSVLFDDDRIFLSNYMFTQERNGKMVKRFMVPRFQLTGLSWDELLFENKLKAQQAVLYDPVIFYSENNRASGKSANRNLFQVMAGINEIVMLEDLRIVNGDIEARINDNIQMRMEDATLSIESRSLLGSRELSSIRRSVNQLDFSKGHFRFNDFTIVLDNIHYTGAISKLNAATAKVFNNSGSVKAVVNGIVMDEIFINENTGDVKINGISWKKADVKIEPFAKSSNTAKSKLELNNIRVNDTRVSSTGNKKLNVFLHSLSADHFILLPGQKPNLSGLKTEGKSLVYSFKQNEAKIDEFSLNDKNSSFLNGVVFNSGNKINFRSGQVNFIPDIQATINGEIKLQNASLLMPVININSEVNESEPQPWSLPLINIDKLYLGNPRIQYSNQTVNGRMEFKWDYERSRSGSLSFTNFRTNKTSVEADEFKLQMSNFSFKDPNGKSFESGPGEIVANMSRLFISKTNGEPAEWKTLINSLDGKNFIADSLGNKNGKLTINTLQLKDLTVSSAIKGLRQIIKNNASFRIQEITGNYENSDHKMDWQNVVYDKNSKLITVDSFKYRPALSKDSFVSANEFQADYINLRTGPLTAGPFDLDQYLEDSTLKLGVIKVDGIRFSDHRDNRLPFKTGIIKPLMVNRIKDIPYKISIDSILVYDAQASYTEVNAMTKQEGTVPMNFSFVKFFPVKNFDLKEGDSLRIQANAWIMDSIWVRLRLRESYTDSLGGFLMTVRIKPADMRILNSILPQFARATIESGYLDTLNMRVAGGEYMAYGEMDMFYRDLKVRILPKHGRKTLTSSLINFIANTFVIKNENRKRTGNVFFIRNREKSAFNYLVKILVSGVTTSVGAKGNKKAERSYKKELRKRNLPPLDYD